MISEFDSVSLDDVLKANHILDAIQEANEADAREHK